MNIKTLLLSLILGLVHNVLLANNEAINNENLWTTGKIYVVLIVVLIIFLGIVFFLLHLENRIRKLEK